MRFIKWAWTIILLCSIQVYAQKLPIPLEMERAYQKGTRDKSGLPGKNYWQNSGSYAVDIKFNPLTRLVEGEAKINYLNNSPDELKEIHFKLYANLYKKGVEIKTSIKEEDKGEGVTITDFELDGQLIEPSSIKIEGTNMKISGLNIPSGKPAKIHLKYNYVLNKGSHVRTGQVDPGAFFIAYSIPRIAVYDDVDGWNTFPYNGSEEFYNDFSDFTVNITVPKGYVVWATGDLTNAKDVFSTNVLDKYRRAEKSGALIDVIDSLDLKAGNVTQQKNYNTFKFDAKNVPDFAFSLSNHYLWKAKSLVVDSLTGRRTRVDAVFNKDHKDYFEVIDFAYKTVKAMSFNFPKWPFPYNHMTVFDGLDQMEYPMMANDNPTDTREDGIALTIHEIFHTMFPFYMGTNETKHAWMDEGWATIGEWLIAPMIDSTFVNTYGVIATAQNSGSQNNQPNITPTPALKGMESFINNYPKPAFAYLYLKEMLGDELFTKTLHHYIKSWNGKHPTPLDFFNSMNTGSGKDLNWYWKKWFYETGIMDIGINGVIKTSNGYQISVENKGNYPMSVDLQIIYKDGSSQRVFNHAGVWEDGKKVFLVNVSTHKPIAKVVLGNAHLPDKNTKDNTFVIN